MPAVAIADAPNAKYFISMGEEKYWFRNCRHSMGHRCRSQSKPADQISRKWLAGLKGDPMTTDGHQAPKST
jgi:hypothetical protein